MKLVITGGKELKGTEDVHNTISNLCYLYIMPRRLPNNRHFLKMQYAKINTGKINAHSYTSLL